MTMLRGTLVVHGADLEKLVRKAISDSGLRLSPDREEDLLCELLLVAWELSGKHDEQRYPGQFAAGACRLLRLRIVDGYVRPFHDARHSALMHMAATGSTPVAIMATAGHASMANEALSAPGRRHLQG
jgi:integrase